MAADMPWDLYRSFLGVLREGSLSGAARALDIAQPTAGRHVAALERGLAVALFTRTQLGLVATEAALALRPHAEAMETLVASMARVASGQGEGVRGAVRVSASEVVGVEVLPPLLAGLRDRHPDLTVELVLSNEIQDLLRQEADIAVRMVRPQQERLVARSVGAIELGLHAHRDYLRQRGTPQGLADLAGHAVIGFDRPSSFVREAAKLLPGLSREGFAWRTDSDLARLALIRCGAGIGVCQVSLARRDDSLVRVLPKLFAMKLPTWVVMHEDLRQVPRCRVTFDAFVEGLRDYAAP